MDFRLPLYVILISLLSGTALEGSNDSEPKQGVRNGTESGRKWDQDLEKQGLVERLKRHLNLLRSEDWYKVSAMDFRAAGGRGYLARFWSSPKLAIQALSDEGLIEPPKGGWKEEEFGKKVRWSRESEKRKLVEKLKNNLDLRTSEDWYGVSKEDFRDAGGLSFLNQFSTSSRAAIQALSKEGLIPPPKGGWQDVEFGKQTSWDRNSTRKQLVETLKQNLDIRTSEDWYKVSVKDFQDAGGTTYLQRFSSSPRLAIQALSEEGLIKGPRGGWNDKTFGMRTKWHRESTRKELVETLKRNLNIRKSEDWYQVWANDIRAAGGSGFLRWFSGSPKLLIQSLSEEGLIKPPKGGWRDEGFSRGKWDLESTRKQLVETLEKNLDLRTSEDWYKVSGKDFQDAGGTTYLQRFSSSPKLAIQALSEQGLIKAPKRGWQNEKFGRRTSWDRKSTRRNLVETLRKNLGLKAGKDWYRVSEEDFLVAGGLSFLKRFSGSPRLAIQFLSEEGFINPPKGGWKDVEFGKKTSWDRESTKKELVSRISEKLDLKTPEAWYGVSGEDIRQAGGGGYLARFSGGPKRLVQTLSKEGLIDEPPGGWVEEKFYEGLKTQKRLASFAERLLGEAAIHNDRRSHGVRNPKTNYPLEADVSFPSLKIAIEYQGGDHHYEDSKTIERDSIKRVQFPQKGWLLIVVEKTWKRSEQNVRDLITQKIPQHPDPQIREKLLKRLQNKRCRLDLFVR